MNLSARSPRKTGYLTSRRQKSIRYRPHVYKYTLEANPDAMVVVYALMNERCEMNDIDPQLFPSMLPLLREKERQLKEWRNQPASKTIASAIEFITNYRYSEDPNQNPQLLERGFTQSLKGPTQEDVDYALQLLICGRSVDQIDPSVRKQVGVALGLKRKEALQQGDYLLAEKCVNQSRALIALQNEERYEEIQTQRTDMITEKYNQCQNDFQTIKEQWDQKLQAAAKQRDDSLKQLDINDSLELQEFDKVFDSPVPSEFLKPSSTLLQLKCREQYMVSSGRYAEANDVRSQALELEAQEKEAGKKRYLAELNLKRQEFIKKQQDKHAAREMAIRNQYDKTVARAELECERASKMAHKLEDKIDEIDRNAMMAARSTKNRSLNDAPDPKAQAALFRQRAKINTIVYTKTITPRNRNTNTITNQLYM
ncbi:hypothetical protein TVAG_000660 [Trichomonas vaginalis G3]|uniref:Uncharacterized protein n=1 Tax=Trichomonas vaginalis (strain ATCC PRA-98 / G3) TaxID=412133 RepID=A2EHU2_TRIV3|nr:hypothetical protein TVAGG3_0076960 [Trichomonas vaginalis G3]EAY07782.1 hypothetical protein TVAG_000660 [Trichomonas vaginalis G3]KAI5542943.1 hypothetical protein TVAGG3_0076960 [Trichomonas vaginalis G3]|eukprot:XP_001320005.1 hypothetical protein [Trichomonas vaginalis G3]